MFSLCRNQVAIAQFIVLLLQERNTTDRKETNLNNLAISNSFPGSEIEWVCMSPTTPSPSPHPYPSHLSYLQIILKVRGKLILCYK